MFLRIELYQGSLLLGMQQIQTFQEHTTPQLWARFMPQVASIPHRIDNCLLSAEVFDADFFNPFDIKKPYSKWAGVRVLPHTETPTGMSQLMIPEGLYAVFLHKGLGADAEKTYRYIFLEWLPQSGYSLDLRPHFAVMPPGYTRHNPEEEEEIWIPILETRE